MAKVVINIPENIYNECLAEVYFPDTGGILWDAVRKGVVLPKGHGRLVDANEVGKYVIIGNADLRKCPTIIEADKEG